MMAITNIQLILFVNFLHFFCAGLALPFLPHFLATNGASCTSLGILSSITYICQELSKDFVALIENGKKYTIMFSQFYCFLFYFMCVFYTDFYILSLARYCYALTTRVTEYSQEYVKKIEPASEHVKYFNILHCIKSVGVAVGSVTGGYIYKCDSFYASNCMISSIFTLVTILLLQAVDDDAIAPIPPSDILAVPKKFLEGLNELPYFNFKAYWEDFLLKFSFLLTYLVCFTNLSFLLSFNYSASSVHIGQALAICYVVGYLSASLVPFIINVSENKAGLLGDNMIIGTFLLWGAFYAPGYNCCMLFLPPIILTYTVANCLLEVDVFELKDEAGEVDTTLVRLTNIFAPIFYGIIWDIFGGSVYKISVLMPMTVSCFLVTWQCLRSEEAPLTVVLSRLSLQ